MRQQVCLHRKGEQADSVITEEGKYSIPGGPGVQTF